MAFKRPVMVLVCLHMVELFSEVSLVQVSGLRLNESSCKCAEFPLQERPFVAVWNAPTEGCRVNFSININLKDFDILENPNQTWNGKFVTVFYNAQLGLYPYFTNDEGTQNYNGGMPQLINLTAHFAEAKKNIIKKIPDPNYRGLVVIDWEGWRPTWERNFDSKRIYQSKSVELMQAKYPEWPMVKLIEAAKDAFERSGRVLMQGTIKLGKRLRPNGLWGFYGFPDCFASKVNNYQCSKQHKHMNNKLGWLFLSSDALYPSIYMYDQDPSNAAFAHGRLREAFRLASHSFKNMAHAIPVFPYFRHVYEGKDPFEFKFLSDDDLHNTIGQAGDMGAAGVVMWGNRRDENTSPDVCHNLDQYIHNKMGPYFKSVKQQVEACSESRCNGRGRCINKEEAEKQGLLSGEPCTGQHRSFTTQHDSGTSDKQIMQAILQLQRKPTSHGYHGVNISSSHLKMHTVSWNHSVTTPTLHPMKHKAKKPVTNNSGKLAVALHIKDKLGISSTTNPGGTSMYSVHYHTLSTGNEHKRPGSNRTDTIQSGVTESGGLHYRDEYQRGSPTRKPGTKLKAPNGIVFCKHSDSGSPRCVLSKRHPLARATHGAHIPQAYMFVIGASLGSALLLSTVYIVTYYYFNIRKKMNPVKDESETQPILENVETRPEKENNLEKSNERLDRTLDSSDTDTS